MQRRDCIYLDKAVTNLLEFFERFKQFNIQSDEQLDRLVADARFIVTCVQPQDLRDHGRLRQHVANELVRVEAALESWMTDRPRRSILRRSRCPQPEPAHNCLGEPTHRLTEARSHAFTGVGHLKTIHDATYHGRFSFSPWR